MQRDTWQEWVRSQHTTHTKHPLPLHVCAEGFHPGKRCTAGPVAGQKAWPVRLPPWLRARPPEEHHVATAQLRLQRLIAQIAAQGCGRGTVGNVRSGAGLLASPCKSVAGLNHQVRTQPARLRTRLALFHELLANWHLRICLELSGSRSHAEFACRRFKTIRQSVQWASCPAGEAALRCWFVLPTCRVPHVLQVALAVTQLLGSLGQERGGCEGRKDRGPSVRGMEGKGQMPG